jgi:hypothetical protein
VRLLEKRQPWPLFVDIGRSTGLEVIGDLDRLIAGARGKWYCPSK